MRTIQVDQPTYELYHAIQQRTHDTHFLYRALKIINNSKQIILMTVGIIKVN